MKYLAAYLLLTIGGKTSPSAKDITSVLESVGIEVDSERLNTLIKELDGKDINEVSTNRKQCAYVLLTNVEIVDR